MSAGYVLAEVRAGGKR